MPLSWIAPAAGAITGLLSDGGGSPTQSQTVSKDPWSVAAPWLTQNVKTGQDLQNYYQTNPFNAQQQQAYGQLSQGNAYTNALIPSLLSQISGQPGFDRSNPRAKPAGISFDVGGNLGFGGGSRGVSGGGDQAAYDRAYQYLDAQHREKYGIPFAQSGDKAGMERELAKIRAETGMSGTSGYGFGGDMNIANNPFANGGIRPPAQAAATGPAQNPGQDEMYQWWLQNTPNRYNSFGGGGGGGGGDGGF